MLQKMTPALLLSLALGTTGCGGGGGSEGGNNNPSSPAATHSVAGTVSGLVSPGLVLQLNGSSDLSIDVGPAFTFADQVAAGSSYTVTVLTNPAGQTCEVVSGGSGVMGSADITDISIACSTPPVENGPYSIGGTVSGLTAAGLSLSNGSEQLTLPANATQFTFPTPLAAGAYYNVGIVTQPGGLTCALINQSGTASTTVTTVTVTCEPTPVQPGLSISKDSLSFMAEQGASLPTQTIVGTIQGATAPVYVKISHTLQGISWAVYTQLSSISGQLAVGSQGSLRSPGTYNDTITLKACYDTNCTQHVPGSPKTIPVTTTITPPQPPAILQVSEQGVALTSAPGQASLTRSLTVVDTSGTASSWTAVSNQSWLDATPDGTSGGALALTANPAGLADGFHEALITVASSNTELDAQNIRVGLYVSSNAAAATFAIKPTMYSAYSWIPPVNWVVDPVRPLVYNANGDAIAIDHSYTGERVGAMSIAEASYAAITVSDDGSYLYALNNTTKQLDVFDLGSRQRIHSYDFPQFPALIPFNQVRISYSRTMGKPVIILGTIDIGGTGVMPIIDADSGQQVGTTGHNMSRDLEFFVLSRNGRVLYLSEAGLSGILRVHRVTLNRNSLGNIYGLYEASTAGHGVASLQDIATSFDGSQLYVSWGGQFDIHKADIHHFSYESGALSESLKFPYNFGACSSLEVDLAGRVACLKRNSLFWALSPDGNILREESATTLGAEFLNTSQGALRITSDGLRLIGNGVIIRNN